MLPKMTEIPHGCGRRTSTDSKLRTHAFLPPSAATRWRYVVRSCRELHYAYQRPLSFKNFYFPLFEYANILSFVIRSHLASTPSCCCPILVSLHLSVSFSCKQKQKKTCKMAPISSHRPFIVWVCCNICSSRGLYVFTGITQPAQTLPSERAARSHTHTEPHTGPPVKNCFSTWRGLCDVEPCTSAKKKTTTIFFLLKADPVK